MCCSKKATAMTRACFPSAALVADTGIPMGHRTRIGCNGRLGGWPRFHRRRCAAVVCASPPQGVRISVCCPTASCGQRSVSASGGMCPAPFTSTHGSSTPRSHGSTSPGSRAYAITGACGERRRGCSGYWPISALRPYARPWRASTRHSRHSDMMTVPLNGDAPAWDEFVARDPASSFCHLSGWRDILSDTLGAKCLYRVATNGDGAWEGVLPLVSIKSRIFGHYLVSVPFLNYGGPLGSPAARRYLVEDAVSEARSARADLLELRTRDGAGDGADLDLPVASRKVTVLLPLPSSSEELFKSFPSKLRSQIRRPMKEGLTVRFGLHKP